MVICSNMSNQEAYRLTGFLPADRIEDLLDKEAKLQQITALYEDSDNLSDEEIVSELHMVMNP